MWKWAVYGGDTSPLPSASGSALTSCAACAAVSKILKTYIGSDVVDSINYPAL